MKKLFLLLGLCTLGFSSYAQEGSTPNWKNEVGLHAGFTTGAGLSYRYWFSRAGVQLTALPIKSSSFTLMSVGGSFLYTFKEFEYSRFYGYVGAHYLEHKTSSSDDTNERLNLGFGPALALGKQIRFNIMVGYGVFNVTGKTSMYPTGELGVYYNF